MHTGCFDLRTICKELSRVPDKLIAIGVQLGISHNKVTKFMKEDEPLSAVINFWLSGNVKKIPLNWQSIVKALKSGHVDETKLANKIISRYQLDGKKDSMLSALDACSLWPHVQFYATDLEYCRPYSGSYLLYCYIDA